MKNNGRSLVVIAHAPAPLGGLGNKKKVENALVSYGV